MLNSHLPLDDPIHHCRYRYIDQVGTGRGSRDYIGGRIENGVWDSYRGDRGGRVAHRSCGSEGRHSYNPYNYGRGDLRAKFCIYSS